MDKNQTAILLILLISFASCKPDCSDTQNICVKTERIKVIDHPYSTMAAVGAVSPMMGIITDENYEDECIQYKTVPNLECISAKQSYARKHPND